ncbi:MAG: cysteine-rich small domain-containing protein [Spirochaetales bacterium]|nr:cysteine-rich small domain-containing protein [Spirochaetales bacterium]
MKNNYRFFANIDCEYYPCHKGIEELNCLFCYCPLYPFMDCGGNYSLTKEGIKDCSNCIKPHIPENYDLIMNELRKRLSRKAQ